MPVTKPGPKPQFTEDFLVKFRPEQRQALDRIAEAIGASVSHLIREFIDHGIATVDGALAAVDQATPEEVVAALVGIGCQQRDIDRVIANIKES